MRWAVIAATIAVIAIAVVGVTRCGDRGGAPNLPSTPSPTRARLLELRRQPLGAIAGSVTADGAALAAATVCARSGELAARCVTTDARGGYLIDGLAPDGYVIWASAPTFLPDPGAAREPSVWIGAGERRTGIDLVLTSGAVLVTGIVTDVRGRPIGGAVLHVGDTSRAAPMFTTRSEVDGRFRAWAAPGQIHVVASADGFVNGDADGEAPSDQLAIELTPESVLAGIVVEAGSRRPLADVEVEVQSGIAQTDATGRFRLTKLGPGRYKPKATGIGVYGEATESVLVSLGQTVEEVVIEVHPVAVVVGRVVIDDGVSIKPCPPDQGDVVLFRYGSTAVYRTRTIDDGVIVLEGVVPGLYEVTVTCARWLGATPYADLTVADSDVGDVTWKVVPGAKIVGHVVSPGGAPIADAVVNHIGGNGITSGSVKSDRDGAFVAEGVAVGTTELVAYATGFEHSAPVKVTSALATVAHAELALVFDPGGSIAGLVVDEAGRPVASTMVRARGPKGGAARTDVHGAFVIAGVGTGSYEVSAGPYWEPLHRPDASVDGVHAVEAVVTTAQITRVRLVAESTEGVIVGTVADAAGAPITDAYVAVARELEPDGTRGPWNDRVVLADLEGKFQIAGLPPGRFSLRAYRVGGGEVIASHVVAGDRARLILRPTGVLSGIVVGLDGGVVDDVTIEVDERLLEIARGERLFRTGGRFTLRDLPGGTYRVTVDSDPRSSITVTLAEGARRTDLRLVRQPRFTLRGRLVNKAGRPQSNWTVEAAYATRSEPRSNGRVVVYSSEFALTDADGRFLIRNLPGGEVSLLTGDVANAPDTKLEPLRELMLRGATEVGLGDIAIAN